MLNRQDLNSWLDFKAQVLPIMAIISSEFVHISKMHNWMWETGREWTGNKAANTENWELTISTVYSITCKNICNKIQCLPSFNETPIIRLVSCKVMVLNAQIEKKFLIMFIAGLILC